MTFPSSGARDRLLSRPSGDAFEALDGDDELPEAGEVTQRYVDARPVDSLVLVEDRTAHPGGLNHQLRQGGGKNVMLSQQTESLTRGVGRAPPLLRDEVFGNVDAVLHRERQIERQQV